MLSNFEDVSLPIGIKLFCMSICLIPAFTFTGSMEYVLSVSIIDDDIYEGREYLTISVVEPSGFEYINTTIVIRDNEGELNNSPGCQVYILHLVTSVHIHSLYLKEKKKRKTRERVS